MAKVAMLGAGFIGDFYTFSIHGQRNRDKVHIIYSRDEARGKAFAKKHGIPRWTTSMKDAVNDPEVEVVIIGLPNNLHRAVKLAAAGRYSVPSPLGKCIEAKKCLT
jgi:predicted dehydrogenase